MINCWYPDIYFYKTVHSGSVSIVTHNYFVCNFFNSSWNLKCFDMGLEVREIFLDISKAFGNVWHDALILKLRQNNIWGEIINILQDFISHRKQGVVLNDPFSSWADIHVGESQGSILGPLLFLIYSISIIHQMILKVKTNGFAYHTSLSFLVQHWYSSK